MPWHKAGAEELPGIEKFIRLHELTATSLSSRMKAQSGESRLVLPPESRGELYVHGKHGAPDALIYLERGGFSFPLFDPAYGRNTARLHRDRELQRILGPHSHFLYSVMGIRNDVNHFTSLLDIKPYHRVEYRVMSRGPESHGATLDYDGRFRIRTASIEDGERLLPLQLSYEEEEVLIPGKRINRRFTLSQLNDAIQKQRVIYAQIDGVPVAKAQTNAIGLSVEQIGGVYTDKGHRNFGFGTVLVEKISRMIIADGHIATLFVKTANTSARRVYEKCGYHNGPDFTIAYYY